MVASAPEFGDLDAAVKAAIEEHRSWHEQAMPSAKFEPRVLVGEGPAQVLRRPFKSRGAWSVRLAGVARLAGPRRVEGQIVFTADYGRVQGPMSAR